MPRAASRRRSCRPTASTISRAYRHTRASSQSCEFGTFARGGAVSESLAQFNTVEVDSTFYALPAERNATRWAERTPTVSSSMRIVDSATAMAAAVNERLNELRLSRPRGMGSQSFFVTETPERFVRVGRRFFGPQVESAVRLER